MAPSTPVRAAKGPSATGGPVADDLLELQLLAGRVQPQQRAGLQAQRLAQQIQGGEQLLVDGLDRPLRQLLLLLGARAHPALAGRGRRDEAEVAGLLAHAGHLGLQAAAVLAPLAGDLGVQEGHVEHGEDHDEHRVAGEDRGGRRGGARAEGHGRLQGDGRQGQRDAHLQRWKVTRKLTSA